MHVAWAAFDPMNADIGRAGCLLVWLSLAVIAWLLGALVRGTRLNAEQRRVNREQGASRPWRRSGTGSRGSCTT